MGKSLILRIKIHFKPNIPPFPSRLFQYLQETYAIDINYLLVVAHIINPPKFDSGLFYNRTSTSLTGLLAIIFLTSISFIAFPPKERVDGNCLIQGSSRFASVDTTPSLSISSTFASYHKPLPIVSFIHCILSL